MFFMKTFVCRHRKAEKNPGFLKKIGQKTCFYENIGPWEPTS